MSTGPRVWVALCATNYDLKKIFLILHFKGNKYLVIKNVSWKLLLSSCLKLNPISHKNQLQSICFSATNLTFIFHINKSLYFFSLTNCSPRLDSLNTARSATATASVCWATTTAGRPDWSCGKTSTPSSGPVWSCPWSPCSLSRTGHQGPAATASTILWSYIMTDLQRTLRNFRLDRNTMSSKFPTWLK